MPELLCFQCQNKIEFVERLSFREECSQCRSDAHVCKNCEFYDPKVYHECRETQADYVAEKSRANRCDYFTPGRAGAAAGSKAQDLLAAAEALFKKS